MAAVLFSNNMFPNDIHSWQLYNSWKNKDNPSITSRVQVNNCFSSQLFLKGWDSQSHEGQFSTVALRVKTHECCRVLFIYEYMYIPSTVVLWSLYLFFMVSKKTSNIIISIFTSNQEAEICKRMMYPLSGFSLKTVIVFVQTLINIFFISCLFSDLWS